MDTQQKVSGKFYTKRWFSTVVVVVVIFIAIGMISNSYNGMQSAASSAKNSADQSLKVLESTSSDAQATSPQSVKKTVTTSVPAPAPAPHQAVVLLQLKGSGTKSTQTFTAPSNWTLDYTYDCSSFSSGRGNFQVYIFNVDGSMSPASGVNQLGSTGSDTEYYHQGGSLYLEVNSECSWTVTAKG
jgi:hypothetical protein